jgi:riboflavin kinase/FMN adenylyltransferase
MTVYTEIDAIQFDVNTVLTVGTFDGLHRGHKEILRIVKKQATALTCRSLVVTFDPHPRLVLDKKSKIKMLSTLEEKKTLFESEGIDVLVILPFNESFAQLSSEEFFEKYLVSKIGLKEIIVGYDHRFGKGRDGDEDTIREIAKKHNFSCMHVPAVQMNGLTISSTLIRNFLKSGYVKAAAEYLGHNYEMNGRVIEGARRGRTIDFPTANVGLEDKNKLVPGYGVYAVLVKVDGVDRKGVMNIGVRPTFDETPLEHLEVHIMDFNEDVYGKEITVTFIERIREEKKFASVDELKAQIAADKNLAIKILENIFIN